MLTTVETIQISDTTTSCRVRIGDVDFEATLDDRYRRYSEPVEEVAQARPTAQADAPAAGAQAEALD